MFAVYFGMSKRRERAPMQDSLVLRVISVDLAARDVFLQYKYRYRGIQQFSWLEVLRQGNLELIGICWKYYTQKSGKH